MKVGETCETSTHRTFLCVRYPPPKSSSSGGGLAFDLKVSKQGLSHLRKLSIYKVSQG